MTRRPQDLLEVARLRRRQLVVDDDQIGAGFVARGAEHLGLAAADERRRIRSRAFLHRAQHDLGAGGSRQTFQFVEGEIGIDVARGARDQADERRAFEPWCG